MPPMMPAMRPGLSICLNMMISLWSATQVAALRGVASCANKKSPRLRGLVWPMRGSNPRSPP